VPRSRALGGRRFDCITAEPRRLAPATGRSPAVPRGLDHGGPGEQCGLVWAQRALLGFRLFSGGPPTFLCRASACRQRAVKY
jgi:hypothetical protein